MGNDSSQSRKGEENDFPEVSALLEKQGARIDSERRGQSPEAQFGILLELYREMAEKAKSLEQRLTRSETGPSLGLVHPGDNCPMCGEIKPIPRLSERGG